MSTMSVLFGTGAQISKNVKSHLKILDVRMVTASSILRTHKYAPLCRI